MTTVRHLAHAVGSTGAATPPYRVDVRIGTHELTADEPASLGGGDVGPSPMAILLGALVACTATTLRMYATRKAWDLASIEVDVRYDTSDDGSTAIVRTITASGDLTAEQRQRLGEVAERTPVTVAIRDGVPIATTITSPNA